MSTVVAIFAGYFYLCSKKGCVPFASGFVVILSCRLHYLTSRLLFWWVESLKMEFWAEGQKIVVGQKNPVMLRQKSQRRSAHHHTNRPWEEASPPTRGLRYLTYGATVVCYGRQVLIYDINAL